MSEPRLTILGVYRPVIDEKTWREQWEVTADDEETQKHFDGLVLIEAIAENLKEPFDIGKFGQMQLDFPDDPMRMMVGWDEGLLSADGKKLILRERDCLAWAGDVRFAAYLHLYDPDRPLQWQYGYVNCPPVQDVPPRLMQFMPYIPN